MTPVLLTPLLLAIGVTFAIGSALAQTPPAQAPSADQPESVPALVYKPPSRGAPEGRVGGGSRGAAEAGIALPRIEVIAPGNHAGFTAVGQPTLYFFVSRPVQWQMQFTISAPLQPIPVLEVSIPSPRAGGVYELPLTSYGVRLQPGTVYTWSVSILVDPREWSRNIVASAQIGCDPTLAASSPNQIEATQRAVYFAEKGLWYDAIAAAAEAQRRGANSAMSALLQQGGLSGVSANAIAN